MPSTARRSTRLSPQKPQQQQPQTAKANKQKKAMAPVAANTTLEPTSSRPSRRAKTIAAQKLDSSNIQPVDDEIDNDENEDEDDDEEFSAEEDRAPQQSRKRKPTQSATKNTSGRKAKQPRAKAPPRRSTSKKVNKKNANEPALYLSLMDGDSTAELESWAQKYEEEMYPATAEMIGLFVKCSGCNEVVTTDMLPEIEDACGVLVENFGEESDGYPLAARPPKDRQFRERLDLFVEQMVSACQASILHDGYFLQTLITWLTTLGSSSVRALRHTATYAALKIGHNLITLKLELQEQIEVTQRQIKSETKKAGKKMTQKVTSLKNQLKSFDNQMVVYNDTLENLNSGVIVHRYRDVSPQIRQLSLEELGTWIHRLPDPYLDDTYLKYLGWSLNDKDASVRNSSILSLLTICSEEGREESLDLFTQRFKLRLVNMCEDTSDLVATNALKMMTVLARMNILEPDDSDRLLEFMFSESIAQRKNAGAIFQKAIIEAEFDPVFEEFNESSPTSVDRSDALLKFIVQKIASIGSLFSDCKSAYVVDSLFDHVDELVDWEAYHRLLQQDNREQEQEDEEEEQQPLDDTTLSPKEELILFELMTSSAMRATECLSLPGRPLKNAKLNFKQRQQVQTHSESISNFFIKILPDMMVEFGADSDKASLLLMLPQTFDLEMYEKNHAMKQFDATLVQIKEIVLRNSDADVLTKAVEALMVYGDNDLTLESKTEKMINSLLDTIFKQLKSVLNKGVPEDTDSDETDMSPESFLLVGTLRRLNCFAAAVDTSHLNILPLLSPVIQKGVDDDLHECVLSVALELYLKSLVLKLSEIELDESSRSEIEAIAALRDEFVVHCEALLNAGTELVQRTAYSVVMDCVQVFNPRYAVHNNLFAKLALDLDGDLQQGLFDYLLHCLTEALSASNSHVSDSAKKRKAQSQSQNRNVKRRSNNTDDAGDMDEDEEVEDTLQRLSLTPELFAQVETDAISLHKALAMLSAFTAAIAFGGVDSKFLGKLLPLYTQSSDVGELMRFLLSQMREHNPQALAQGLASGFEEIFEEIMDREENDEQDSERSLMQMNMLELKELAHRIALTYGIDLKKTETRTSIITLHRRGIDFALSGKIDESGCPLNIRFLEVVKELSLKLHKQDKSGNNSVDEYLKAAMRGKKIKARRNDDAWDSYFIFADALVRSTGSSNNRSSSAVPSSSSKKRKSLESGSSSRKIKGRKPTQRKSTSSSTSSSQKKKQSGDGFWGVLPSENATLGDDNNDDEEEEIEEEEDPLEDYVSSDDDDIEAQLDNNQAEDPIEEEEEDDDDDNDNATDNRSRSQSKRSRKQSSVNFNDMDHHLDISAISSTPPRSSRSTRRSRSAKIPLEESEEEEEEEEEENVNQALSDDDDDYSDI